MGPAFIQDAVAANKSWIQSGSAALGVREGLESYEGFGSEKASWTMWPTRASLVTVCPRWHPDQLQADTLVSSGPGMCRARLVCSGPRVCMILGSSVGPRSCWVAAGPISSMHRSPVSSLQQAPLHRFGVTRTHRRSLGRVGRDPTSSERSPYSHQKCCESRRRAARGAIICSYKFSCRRAFFNFRFSRLVH